MVQIYQQKHDKTTDGQVLVFNQVVLQARSATVIHRSVRWYRHNVPDGAVGHTMHEDMQCVGFDYTNPNIKLGITTRQIELGSNEHRDNLDFVDIPVEEQTYGNFLALSFSSLVLV